MSQTPRGGRGAVRSEQERGPPAHLARFGPDRCLLPANETKRSNGPPPNAHPCFLSLQRHDSRLVLSIGVQPRAAAWAHVAQRVLRSKVKGSPSAWSIPFVRAARHYRLHVETPVLGLEELRRRARGDALAVRDRDATRIMGHDGCCFVHVPFDSLLQTALLRVSDADRDAAKAGAMPLRVWMFLCNIVRVLHHRGRCGVDAVVFHCEGDTVSLAQAAISDVVRHDALQGEPFMVVTSEPVDIAIVRQAQAKHIVLTGSARDMMDLWHALALADETGHDDLMARTVVSPLPNE